MPGEGEIRFIAAGVLNDAIKTLRDPAADHTADIEWLNSAPAPLTIDRVAEFMGCMAHDLRRRAARSCCLDMTGPALLLSVPSNHAARPAHDEAEAAAKARRPRSTLRKRDPFAVLDSPADAHSWRLHSSRSASTHWAQQEGA